MIKKKHNRRSKPIKMNEFDKSNTLQISMYYVNILYPENIARLQLHSCTNIYMFFVFYVNNVCCCFCNYKFVHFAKKKQN